MEPGLWLMVLLLAKHYAADFLLQPPFMYQNKGIYGHPGGLVHAWIHGVGTFWALFAVAQILSIEPSLFVIVPLVDVVIHYHIDWVKVQMNQSAGWTPVNSEAFWRLLGFDQFLHQITYIVMVYWVVTFA